MHLSETEKEFKTLVVSSPAFSNGGAIPPKYTCKGKDVNPPLHIENIPGEVKSLALLVDDPDAPGGTWLHWLVWDIPVMHQINEDNTPGVEGINDFKLLKYRGPCPPSGIHRYFFRVYGLDDLMQLKSGASRQDLEHAMQNHIIAYGELFGRFQKI